MKVTTLHQLEKFAIANATYILVAGGIGIGKSHIISSAMPFVPIMDIDHEMDKYGLTKYNEKNMLQCRKPLSTKIKSMIANGASLVAMGTAADTVFTIDRLYGAKQAGMKTALVHITAPHYQARLQNEARREQGRRAVPVEDEYLLRRTITESAMTVSTVGPSTLVDIFIHIDNTRKTVLL